MRIFAAAVMIGAAAVGHAQDNDRLESLTVTVTAPASEADLPLAVSRVQTASQPAPNPQSLQDTLAPVPGLFALNNDNAAQGLRVSIRGFGARAAFGVRGIRVLVDGVPLTLPDGQTELDALDLALLDSIQVVRGPSAALFGNAAGGAILLNTRRPGEQPGLRLDWQQASHDNRRFRLEGSDTVGEYGLLGSYLHTDIDGFREHATSESDLINARLQHRLGDGRFSLSISSLDISAQDPGGLTAAQVRASRRAAAPNNLSFDAGETIEQQRLALSWDGDLRHWSLQATAYAGQRDFANRLPFTDGGQVRFERGFGGLGLTTKRRWGDHQISLGLDAQTQSDERRRFDNNNGQRGALALDQQEDARSVGLFVRDTLSLPKRWEASLGLRYDRLRLRADDAFMADGDDSGSRRLGDWSADASLARRLDRGLVYGRIATSFETPTINELANPDGGGFNPALDSTRAVNYEIGAKGDWRAWRYSAALYHIKVDDELLPFELPGQSGRSFFRNAGTTRRSGVELATERPLSSQWRMTGNLTVARHEFDGGDLDGKELPGIPGETARLALHYGQGRLQAAGIASHVGKLFADDANNTRVEAYTLLDLQLAWHLNPHFSLQGGIDNLLDKDYNDNIRINAFGGRFFEPAAGRRYRINLGYRLGAG